MPKPYIPNDEWSRKAAAEGYRARSVYKLMELDEKFGLLKPGMKVLDCGASPGSWLQYTAAQIGPKGRAIGIDLTPIAPIADNVKTFIVDMKDRVAVDEVLSEEMKFPERGQEGNMARGQNVSPPESNPTYQASPTSFLSSQTSPFDLVLSDIAPSTSGIADVDQWRSIELNQMVAEVAQHWLKPGGRCVLKVFRGADFDQFLWELKRNWAEVKPAHVATSRDRSKEIYLVMRKAPSSKP
ncbi:MAG: RlmE family RNA methyltransferase [Candidatus Peregrinibacteria bacterium]